MFVISRGVPGSVPGPQVIRTIFYHPFHHLPGSVGAQPPHPDVGPSRYRHRRGCSELLDEILERVRERVEEIRDRTFTPRAGGRSLRKALSGPGVAVIAEVKPASPSQGRLRDVDTEDVVERARAYERGGAAGISVLTEPEFFDGRPKYVEVVREVVDVPVLRKDFIIDPVQVEESAHYGADAVLIIAAAVGGEAPELIDLSHEHGMEVLLEIDRREHFELLTECYPDVVGVNNRDLRTLEVDLSRTFDLGPEIKDLTNAPLVAESGVSGPEDVVRLGEVVDAVLVGTYLMRASDPSEAVRELVEAGRSTE
ncbi:indole-3-glycerol phosphate synthase TrpC [Methanopyrus sp.]